jgi:hypothetical protein
MKTKNLVEGALVSYVLAQEEPDQRLHELQRYLATALHVNFELDALKNEVARIKAKLAGAKERERLIATLFTKDGELRKYRFGKAFCAKCGLFKNYEKECPYCGYLELTP